MPYYDTASGINLFEDDICSGCIHYMQDCNVWPDLQIEGKDSQWHNIHIVHEGEEKENNEKGCMSFREYISPKDKQALDPLFGKRISSQEANIRDGVPEATVRRDVRDG